MSSNARTHFAASRLGLGAMLLLGVFAWAPTLYPGYWRTLQGFVPIFNAGQPAAIAAVGVAPDLWRGAGSATNLLTQPWIVLGYDPTTAVRLGFLLAFVIGSCGLYAWLRPVWGDLAAGLAGLVYVLQPIFLSTVYVHGSLADALVLAWLPVALAGLGTAARYRAVEGAAVAVLAIMALWRTQAGLAVLATVLLLAYAIAVERHWAPTLAVLTAAGAAAITLLPLWSLAVPPPVPFADHFVALAQLFDARWAVAPSSAGWQDRYPFQLGFAVIVFSAAALWGWAAVTRRALSALPARLLAFCAVGGALIVLLSLRVSAPLWRLSGAETLLTYPWEVLLLAAPLLAALAGAVVVLLPDLLPLVRTPGRGAETVTAFWVVLVALTVLASYGYLAPVYTDVAAPLRPLAMLGTNQLAVLHAEVTEEGSRATLDVTWQVLQPLASDDNVFFQAIVGEAIVGEAIVGEDAAEQVAAQVDAQPLTERPATTWEPGEIFSGQYVLDITPAPSGAVRRYYFGFYDWQSGTRLPVDGGIDDKLVLYAQ